MGCNVGYVALLLAEIFPNTVGIDIGSSTSHLLFAKVTLQRQSQGVVVPESFTHGTSAQRVRWFRRGFDGADPRQCDTFRARRL